jgi:hypothetical protein
MGPEPVALADGAFGADVYVTDTGSTQYQRVDLF